MTDTALSDLRICPVCGEKYTHADDGTPYHLTCAFDGDHDVCEPDDSHIPADA